MRSKNRKDHPTYNNIPNLNYTVCWYLHYQTDSIQTFEYLVV